MKIFVYFFIILVSIANISFANQPVKKYQVPAKEAFDQIISQRGLHGKPIIPPENVPVPEGASEPYCNCGTVWDNSLELCRNVKYQPCKLCTCQADGIDLISDEDMQ